MAVSASIVDVSTDPVQVTVPDLNGMVGSALALQNVGSVTVFLGGADVDTDNGFPLAAGAQVSFEFDDVGDQLFAVAASATTVARLVVGV